MELPAPLRTFFSHFPIHSYPAIHPPTKFSVSAPTIWIHTPRNPDVDLLSNDVECLKWQAYLAFRGLTNIATRWDIALEGGMDGRLPSLHVPFPGDTTGEGELLAPRMIPDWLNLKRDVSDLDELEGYKDQATKDESHAWVSLLEGNVHAALVLSQSQPFSLLSLISPTTSPVSTETFWIPPPAPFSGLSSLLPPYGVRVPSSTVELQYREAIASLSERLGTDKWFLGSDAPTALDALVFAYLHSILHAKDNIRIEVTRRVNLVAWEQRVRIQVRSAFQRFSYTE